MAVTLFKQDKVLVIAQEILNTGADSYDITGIDLSKALYFYIEPQRTSQEMALGDYNIRVEGANQYIDIYDSDMKDNADRFQICYEETLDSSQYNPVGDPDIFTLVDRYNEVQQDLGELWDAFATAGFKIDALGQAQVLPLLGDGEGWYWDEASQTYRGIPIAVIQQNLDDIDEYVETVTKPNIDAYVISTTLPSIDAYVISTTLPSIDFYVENTTKPDLDNYRDQKIQEIDNATNIHFDFDNIASSKSATYLAVGNRVKTWGYYNIGDGGGAEYKVVSGGTGTDDGGKYHDLDNGLQLELITVFHNVLMFGAKMDGVTDDTISLQNYINAYSYVNIPQGIILSQTVTLKTDTKIEGAGLYATTLKRFGTGFTDHFVKGASLRGVNIKGITIDGNKANAGAGFQHNIYLLDCYDTVIQSTVTQNANGRGLSFDSGQDETNETSTFFSGVISRDNVLDGIATQESSNIILDSCSMYRNNQRGYIFISTGSPYVGNNISVVNCKSFENGMDGITFPLVGTSATPACRNVTITGNNVHDNGENGIVAQSEFLTVTGNTSNKNGTLISHQGILVNAYNLTVSGNTSTENAGVGIDFGDCGNIVCDSNIVTFNGIIGIEVNSTTEGVISDNIVNSNNVVNDAQVVGLGAGILLHLGTGGYPFVGDTERIIVSGNRVQSGTYQDYGILVTSDCNEIILDSNSCRNSGSIQDIKVECARYIEKGNDTSDTSPISSGNVIASASTIVIPDVGNYFEISGTVTINSISTKGGQSPVGRNIVLRFLSAGCTVANGVGNIFFPNTGFTSITTSSTLTVIPDGTGNWIGIKNNYS